jgi:hypothetical protein
LEDDTVVVEKLHFQSSPGLYVTANLYLPKKIEAPLPDVLYVCGHAEVKTNDVSYGNKTAYQHHGAWFARNGYACLVIDTVQLGEIPGLHHGTYREGMWWWNSRGYSPAAVEAWNCIRALDYLETRPEIDKTRFGDHRPLRRRRLLVVRHRTRSPHQSRRPGRRHHRSAQPRDRRNSRRPLRLHVLRQHLRVGLSDARRLRRPASGAHRQ